MSGQAASLDAAGAAGAMVAPPGEPVINVADLPEGHLFQLVYRKLLDVSPVDMEAVLRRLNSDRGRAETRQWVRTDHSTRLFLHQLCDFHFGFADRDAARDGEQEKLNAPMELQVLKGAIDAHPGALGLADSYGYFTLHIICRRELHWGDGSRSPLQWHGATDDAFRLVCGAFPHAASWRVSSDGRTTLNCLMGVHGSPSIDCIQTLLDLHPAGPQIPGVDGFYPLHTACNCGRSFDVVKTLLHRFPQAAQIQPKGWGSFLTPAQHILRMSFRGNRNRELDIVRMIIETCPWVVGIDDGRELHLEWDIDPVGDLLDYIIIKYCDTIGVSWKSPEPFDDNDFSCDYVESHINFSPKKAVHQASLEDVEITLDIFLEILRAMYGKTPFLPLHASMRGRLCRPWNLVIVKEMLRRFGDAAHQEDSDGNLPLHLFLESCFIERSRAIEKGYARCPKDYNEATGICLQLMLEANPDAARTMNGDERLPLHLALENSAIPYDIMVKPLLDLAPWAIRSRDINTRLYPFAAASVGASADLDLAFRLLQRDPSVLILLGIVEWESVTPQVATEVDTEVKD